LKASGEDPTIFARNAAAVGMPEAAANFGVRACERDTTIFGIASCAVVGPATNLAEIATVPSIPDRKRFMRDICCRQQASNGPSQQLISVKLVAILWQVLPSICKIIQYDITSLGEIVSLGCCWFDGHEVRLHWGIAMLICAMAGCFERIGALLWGVAVAD
jgi:hypothetical protein